MFDLLRENDRYSFYLIFLITLIKIGNILVISLFLLPGHIEIILEFFSKLSDFLNFKKRMSNKRIIYLVFIRNIFQMGKVKIYDR